IFFATLLVSSNASAHDRHHGGGVAIGSSSYQATAVRSGELTANSALLADSGPSQCPPSHCGFTCPAAGSGCCTPAMATGLYGAVAPPSTIGKLAALPREQKGHGAAPEALRRPPKSLI